MLGVSRTLISPPSYHPYPDRNFQPLCRAHGAFSHVEGALLQS